MPYRPKVKNADGTLTDLPLESETAVKLKTSRSIGLSGVTATAQSFNGTSAITIPVTAVPGSLLTGSTSIPTSGNAGSATKLETARTIGLSGVTATAQSFNGTANITIPVTAVPASLLTGTIVATQCDGVVKETSGSYTGIAVNSKNQLANGTRIVRTIEPFYITTIGTSTAGYTIMSGDNFPTSNQMYRAVYEDNGTRIFFDFLFPAKTSYSTVEISFSLMFNVAKSNMDQRINTASTLTYKYITWSINHTDKTVKQTKNSAGQCAATTTYFRGLYKLNEPGGAGI